MPRPRVDDWRATVAAPVRTHPQRPPPPLICILHALRAFFSPEGLWVFADKVRSRASLPPVSSPPPPASVFRCADPDTALRSFFGPLVRTIMLTEALLPPLDPHAPPPLGVCCRRGGKMFNARKKIAKAAGVEPTEFEAQVAQALFDLEATNAELKTELRDLYITGAREIDVSPTRKAVLIQVGLFMRFSGPYLPVGAAAQTRGSPRGASPGATLPRSGGSGCSAPPGALFPGAGDVAVPRVPRNRTLYPKSTVFSPRNRTDDRDPPARRWCPRGGTGLLLLPRSAPARSLGPRPPRFWTRDHRCRGLRPRTRPHSQAVAERAPLSPSAPLAGQGLRRLPHPRPPRPRSAPTAACARGDHRRPHLSARPPLPRRCPSAS